MPLIDRWDVFRSVTRPTRSEPGPSCLDFVQLIEADEFSLGIDEQRHVASCTYCQDLLAMMWSHVCPAASTLRDAVGQDTFPLAVPLLTHVEEQRCLRCAVTLWFLARQRNIAAMAERLQDLLQDLRSATVLQPLLGTFASHDGDQLVEEHRFTVTGADDITVFVFRIGDGLRFVAYGQAHHHGVRLRLTLERAADSLPVHLDLHEEPGETAFAECDVPFGWTGEDYVITAPVIDCGDTRSLIAQPPKS
jgi:hypothetical protein